MATQKYYNVVLLVEALIQAHADGKPMNPAGVRGHGMMFTYQETDKEYRGKDVLLGNKIMSTNVQEFVNAINATLSAGLTVIPNTASAIGILHTIRVEGDLNAAKTEIQTQNAAVQEDASEDTENDADSSEDQAAGSADEGETPAPEANEASTDENAEQADDEGSVPEEVQVSDEVESDVEPESGSDGTGNEETDNSKPDWGYAESILGSSKNKTEAKKKLEAYGREFGIELDRNRKFEDMMVDFRAEVNDGEGEA